MGLVTLALSAVISVILWNLPYGSYILYPFFLLGTWFHEMGHGLTAILMGGRFMQLEIFANGSGVAHYLPTNLWLGRNLGQAIIAAGGLLGPPIVGGALIISGSRKLMTHIALWVLSATLLLSAFIWISTAIGLGMIISTGLALMLVSWKAGLAVKQFTVMFLGVQACISTYLQLDYLFMPSARIGMQVMPSDTGQIAENLLLPYWFWGGLIALISVLILIWSLRVAFFSKKSQLKNPDIV